MALSIFTRLRDYYSITQLSPHQLPSDRPEDDPPWPIAALSRPIDSAGEERIVEAVEAQRPDLVWILADLQIVREYARLLQGLRRTRCTRVVAYCPVDLTPLPVDLVAPLSGLDTVITFTEYGRQALISALPSADSGGPTVPLLSIPHGVDSATFFPVSRSEARNRLLGPGHEHDFIVLNANRNQPRKRIDTTVRAFARFARGKPDNVRLFLHMGMHDRGWNIRDLVHRNGLDERVIYTTEESTMPFVDDASLRLIYNVADIGLNTATSEGWGLVAFEHAATGGAQVLPKHSVFEELWSGAAWLVPPRLSLDTPHGLFTEHYVGEEDVADALEMLYGDAVQRQHWAIAARERSSQPRYSWESIAESWHTLFDKLLL